jgi:hypothetical protein
MALSVSNHTVDNSQPPTFPLPAHANIWLPQERSGNITQPYYICTTCDNGKTNVFRDSGCPRRFVTWDDSIGIHPENPRSYCGLPSRKGEKARVKSVGDGFWVCASGACGYFSDRKDGVPYGDARMLLDFDDFNPYLLERILPYC